MRHGGPGRGHHRPGSDGRPGHGGGQPGPLLRRGGHRRPGKPGGRRRGGAHRGIRPHHRHHLVPRARAGSALPDRSHRPAGAAGRALRQGMSGAAGPAPLAGNHRALPLAAPIALILVIVPFVVSPYQAYLFSTGLTYAIAGLGFNLLLGYTGLLSFGHAAYFGVGAYAVAFLVKYFGWSSMEAFLVGGVVAAVFVSALFGFVCVRYTRIFF